MPHFISIIRPANVLLIAASQLIIYHKYIIPYFKGYSISRVLQGVDVFLFVLVTSLIAAGSYIINDIKDYPSDVVNKPTKIYIGKDKLSPRAALIYYWVLTSLGAILAAYIALHIRKPYLFVIYPVAVALLYLYSHLWKRRPLSGNIVVASFCAFVPGIIWYAESEGMALLSTVNPSIVSLYMGYILFGFLATMVREIVKDIEDLNGDKEAGYLTLPITMGEARAKKIALIFAGLLLMSYSLWIYAAADMTSVIVWLLVSVGIVLPTLYIVLRLYWAKAKVDYSHLSRLIKYLMAMSLFVFVGILLCI